MAQFWCEVVGQRRGLSMEALAEASGVSRSMISEVERGAKAPTVVVLARLATALGTTAARFLDEREPDRVIVLRHADQSVIRDDQGRERRVMSPSLPGVEFELIRTTVPPRVLIGDFAAHAAGSREYLAVEYGQLVVTLDGVEHLLGPGDAMYYAGDCVHAFANNGPVDCVYHTAHAGSRCKGATMTLTIDDVDPAELLEAAGTYSHGTVVTGGRRILFVSEQPHGPATAALCPQRLKTGAGSRGAMCSRCSRRRG